MRPSPPPAWFPVRGTFGGAGVTEERRSRSLDGAAWGGYGFPTGGGGDQGTLLVLPFFGVPSGKFAKNKNINPGHNHMIKSYFFPSQKTQHTQIAKKETPPSYLTPPNSWLQQPRRPTCRVGQPFNQANFLGGQLGE